MREIDPSLEQRSFRRGSIQQLCAQPNVTEQTVLTYSGHATISMMRRYNGFAHAEHVAAESRVAATALAA